MLRLFKPLLITASLSAIVYVTQERDYGSSGLNSKFKNSKEEDKKKSKVEESIVKVEESIIKVEENIIKVEESIIKNHSALESDINNKNSNKLEVTSEVKSDVKSEVKSDVKSKVKSDSKSEVKSSEPIEDDDDDSQIDIDCPCLDNMKKGPCASVFLLSATCWNKSKTTPRGYDCDKEFKDMVECFHANDAYYKKLDDEARLKSLERETEELMSDFDTTNPNKKL